MLVRREAALDVGGFDPDFFVYSDETDFCKRLGDAGWRILYVPSARAIHHDQMAQDAAGSERRIVEYHRNRDRYLRKHLGRAQAFLLRPLLAWPYLLRALAALVLPGHSAAPLLAPRPPGAAAGPRRGHPRGRGGATTAA